MKKSTAAVIWAEEQVAMLQPILNIQHWKIDVTYDKHLDAAWAETCFWFNRHAATVTLGVPFLADGRAKREQVMLHELVHIQHEDTMALTRVVMKPQVERLFWAMEEKAVDDMATTLHGLIYGCHP